MKQTAVEWLRDKLWREFNFCFSDNIFEQAKEMEKEDLSVEYMKGLRDGYNKQQSVTDDTL